MRPHRLEQQKLIRYNHLVSNLIVFHNTAHLTKSLNNFALEGAEYSPELLAAFAPYKTSHINRFGHYELDDPDQSVNIEDLELSFNFH